MAYVLVAVFGLACLVSGAILAVMFHRDFKLRPSTLSHDKMDQIEKHLMEGRL